ncbi:NADP-dependent oxidoreductase domain-containing protein [Pseudomassariella vexata]|uniref:NADP-dependent oxidoreductase domain-containing protein n=1 Tax=Pseudomassariella vexata TaxID=1141098 RepID=A0A1Y2E367_9PEZI|nr:NADP-dependent oxidoreductase domain-containing protein [Pseudomassariella vexata]ORY66001.1 NADP-dependent oxidoreductase domain-containing protein [Pseudomassariella vexata]
MAENCLLLGSSGLKVSKVILGCMTFGTSQWEGAPWILDEEESLNDTADTYSNGKSEVIVGKALKKFNIPRSKVVIMTKIFNPVMDDSSRPASVHDGPLVNQMGLSRKHIFEAVDRCLERLGMDYIDVLQLHRLDRETTPEEIMRALHEVVQSGKVRYLGASTTYTWEFARLQYTAKLNGWTGFVSMQPFYNLLYREEEREMPPFCRATGVGVIPWSPLARGMLARPTAASSANGGGDGEKTLRSESDGKTKKWFADANLEIVDAVEKVARDKGVSMSLVATAWVLRQGCWPIVGLNSEKRIKEIVGALKLQLTDEECRFLEDGYRPRSVEGL